MNIYEVELSNQGDAKDTFIVTAENFDKAFEKAQGLLEKDRKKGEAGDVSEILRIELYGGIDI